MTPETITPSPTEPTTEPTITTASAPAPAADVAAPLPDPAAMAEAMRADTRAIERTHQMARGELHNVGSIQEEVERLASIRPAFNEGPYALVVAEAATATRLCVAREQALAAGRELLVTVKRDTADIERQVAEALAAPDVPVVVLERLDTVRQQLGDVNHARLDLEDAIGAAERFSPALRGAAARRREAVCRVYQRRLLAAAQRELVAARDALNATVQRADAAEAALDRLATEGDGFPSLAVPRLRWTGLEAIAAISVTQA